MRIRIAHLTLVALFAVAAMTLLAACGGKGGGY
jgi:predicted small lipoprotein YifL